MNINLKNNSSSNIFNLKKHKAGSPRSNNIRAFRSSTSVFENRCLIIALNATINVTNFQTLTAVEVNKLYLMKSPVSQALLILIRITSHLPYFNIFSINTRNKHMG